jgi:hypothetical protein
MSVERVNEHVWPGREHHRPPGSLQEPERLTDRLNLTVVAVALTGDGPERFGLLAWLLADGEMDLLAGLVHRDGLGDTEPRTLDRLGCWAARHSLETDLGRVERRLEPLSVFNVETYLRHAYRGRASVVSANGGRSVALQSAWRTNAMRAEWRGGWSFGLAGAGRIAKRRRKDGTYREEWWSSPHQPMQRVKPLGSRATKIGFAACPPIVRLDEEGKRVKTPAGVWVHRTDGKDYPYQGRFCDVIPAAYSLGGPDSDDLAEQLRAFALDGLELPAAVNLDEGGAERLTRLVEAVHRFAMVLDQEGATW